MPGPNLDFKSQLEKNQLVYLIHGGEPLLVEDAARELRAAASEQGYDERIVFTVETGFDWQAFAGEFNSLSLFSQKKLIELRMPIGKPGVKGAEILCERALQPSADTLLMVLCGKLETASKNSKWAKHIARHGQAIEFYPIPANQLPGWIKQRASRYRLKINDDACRLLAYFLEGNLLAIDQELKKFTLLNPDRPVSLEDIQKGVEDSARFTIFSYIDAAIAGNLKRALRMLASLKAEGMEPVIINWAIARETRSLLEMSAQLASGGTMAIVLKQNRIWSNRARIVESALKRINLPRWQTIHRQAALLDRMVKGRESTVMRAGIWTEYERLTLQLCKAV